MSEELNPKTESSSEVISDAEFARLTKEILPLARALSEQGARPSLSNIASELYWNVKESKPWAARIKELDATDEYTVDRQFAEYDFEWADIHYLKYLLDND